MQLLQAAEFRTDIPDDGHEDEMGREVQPGRAVAGIFREMLERQNFKCDQPKDNGDHGWEFLCRSRARDIWVSVMFGSEPGYYLTVRDMSWTPFLFWRKKPPPFADVLVSFDRAMKADGRFHDIGWGKSDNIFSRSFESAATPLG